MEISPNITINSTTHHGVPVITGTRVPMSIVVGSLASGMSQEDVMQEYALTKGQIEAALAYATELVAQTTVVPLAGL